MSAPTLACLALVAATALPSMAVAQPARTGSSGAPVEAPPVVERYNPNVALALSIGVPVAGLALAGLGQHNAPLGTIGSAMIFLGPSAGHWYSGDVVTTGLGLRLGGGGLVMVGAVMAFASINGDGNSDGDAGLVVALAGAGMYAVGTIHDVATAPEAARRRNRALAGTRVAVTPTATRRSAGLAVIGSF